MTNTSHQYYGPLSSLAGGFGMELSAFGVGTRTASGGTTGFAEITLGVIAALVGAVPPAVAAEGVGNNAEGGSGMLLLTFFAASPLLSWLLSRLCFSSSVSLLSLPADFVTSELLPFPAPTAALLPEPTGFFSLSALSGIAAGGFGTGCAAEGAGGEGGGGGGVATGVVGLVGGEVALSLLFACCMRSITSLSLESTRSIIAC